MKLKFQDMSSAVVKHSKTKKSVHISELESMISVLLKDYVTFANCKHVDKLLRQQAYQQHLKLLELQQQQRQHDRIEEEERRRKAQGDKTYEVFGDLDDLDVKSVRSEDSSVASQLDLADDMSTMSLMDDMSDTHSQSSTTSKPKFKQLHRSHTNSPSSYNQLPLSPGKQKVQLTPLKLPKPKEKAVPIKLEENTYTNHLNEEEKKYLSNLVTQLSIEESEANASPPSRVQTAASLKLSRHVGHTTQEFLEAQELKSNNIVRHYSIMRRYSMIPTQKDPALEQQSQDLKLEDKAIEEKEKKGKRHYGIESHNTSAQDLIPKAPKQEDWHLKDPEYLRALKHDPNLTPTVYKSKYKAFVKSMKDQVDKQMKYYNSITQHFDRRVEQAQQRLDRARKTGM